MKTLIALVALTLAAAAHAQVITIDQAKAQAGNVTPGDAPGFPVTLSQPGSYRLSGNLTVADPGVHAISITADHVTLDLGGFTIAGPGTCSDHLPITCTPSGLNTVGIDAWNQRMTTIRSGSIRGFGTGVRAGYIADVRGLMVREMNQYGIVASVNSSIVDNNVWKARNTGIVTGGLTRHNVVYLAGAGISAYGMVEGNRVLFATAGIVLSGSGGSVGASGNTLSSVSTPLVNVTQLAPNLCNANVCP